MSSTVGEEPVDDQTTDWEEEDEETPEQLGDRWAVGLEDLDCEKKDVVSYLKMIVPDG